MKGDNDSKKVIEEMNSYALESNVKEMFQLMMEKVLISKPADPLSFLIDSLKNDKDIIALDVKEENQ